MRPTPPPSAFSGRWNSHSYWLSAKCWCADLDLHYQPVIHLVHEVRTVLKHHAIPESALAIQLTETVLADNEVVIAARLRALRDLGCVLAQGYPFSPPVGRDTFEMLPQTWDRSGFAAAGGEGVPERCARDAHRFR
jgi:predicted signal transduction protein with EAL and GGDEF domain